MTAPLAATADLPLPLPSADTVIREPSAPRIHEQPLTVGRDDGVGDRHGPGAGALEIGADAEPIGNEEGARVDAQRGGACAVGVEGVIAKDVGVDTRRGCGRRGLAGVLGKGSGAAVTLPPPGVGTAQAIAISTGSGRMIAVVATS